ncbi:hypothetical protein WKI72_05270 [Candidatus Erwinia dacicola]|uniref:Uncharacterized protein n=1 Tax=Candidatus Erwinia dacicola TaxID=252393 RepID=A0A328TU66_9GAMM|nr:hypothetical protein ACZ87_01793 [Candidatus Erwinia dacicola]
MYLYLLASVITLGNNAQLRKDEVVCAAFNEEMVVDCDFHWDFSVIWA